MAGLEDLYREIVLDHHRSPRNRGELAVPPACKADGFNPLCGDEITVYIQLDGDTITDIKMGGTGCSISQASGSMMSSAVKGRTVAQVRALTKAFKEMMSVHEKDLGGDGSEAEQGIQAEEAPAEEVKMGDLEALQGVVRFPVRIKCATLSWNTLAEAIKAAQAAEVN